MKSSLQNLKPPNPELGPGTSGTPESRQPATSSHSFSLGLFLGFGKARVRRPLSLRPPNLPATTPFCLTHELRLRNHRSRCPRPSPTVRDLGTGPVFSSSSCDRVLSGMPPGDLRVPRRPSMWGRRGRVREKTERGSGRASRRVYSLAWTIPSPLSVPSPRATWT